LADYKKLDRLPILVPAQDETQLLSVPKLPSGTGDAQARAIFQAIEDWNLQDSIEAMCFHTTTSSYTGRINGACAILEQLLGRIYCTLLVATIY